MPFFKIIFHLFFLRISLVPGGGDENSGGQGSSHPLQHRPQYLPRQGDDLSNASILFTSVSRVKLNVNCLKKLTFNSKNRKIALSPFLKVCSFYFDYAVFSKVFLHCTGQMKSTVEFIRRQNTLSVRLSKPFLSSGSQGLLRAVVFNRLYDRHSTNVTKDELWLSTWNKSSLSLSHLTSK